MTRDIKITPVLNGYICKVGCQQVVFETPERLIDELRQYLHRPAEREKEYTEHARNRDLLGIPQPAEPIPDNGREPQPNERLLLHVRQTEPRPNQPTVTTPPTFPEGGSCAQTNR